MLVKLIVVYIMIFSGDHALYVGELIPKAECEKILKSVSVTVQKKGGFPVIAGCFKPENVSVKQNKFVGVRY